MAAKTETRALTAALAGPAMSTRAGGAAMRAANRHVERWAPETTANKSRPLRNLGFVDRTIAPWMETAQRSASLRLFSQYRAEGLGERQGGNVSWVFPRPWYQDELDWMAAARNAPAKVASPAQQMITTRGTYVSTSPQAAPAALPSALYEYIAPSLSVAAPTTQAQGIGFGGNSDAYSPLVSLAAVQAADVMQRAVAPTISRGPAPIALRNVLSTMLERAAAPEQLLTPSRISMQAPTLVTPPHPRAEERPSSTTTENSEAMQLAERYATQRAQIAEVQRVAQQAAEREMAKRVEEARARVAAQTTASQTAAAPDVREASARAEAEVRQRAEQARIAQAAQSTSAQSTSAQSTSEGRAEEARAEAARSEVARAEVARAEVARIEGARAEVARAEVARQEAERARIEERVAQRLAERSGGQRLHDQARAEAAAHARAEAERTAPSTSTSTSAPVPTEAVVAQAPAELQAALAALPPELATFIGQRPDRALAAIDELNDALRTVELLSHAAASGTSFEAARGPRLMMPAGLGGLVAAMDRAHSIGISPTRGTVAQRPALQPLRFAHADAAAMPTISPRIAPTASRAPTMAFLSAGSSQAIAPASAFEATSTAQPAALSHVAWADRWLARFAGASQHSLDTFTAAGALAPESRMQALAAAAPASVFVAPTFDVERAGESVRFDGAGHPIVTPVGGARATAPTLSIVPPPAPALPNDGTVDPTATARRIERAPEVIRYDDNAETPDDVFAAIAAGVAQVRSSAPAAPRAQPALNIAPAAPVSPMLAVDRHTAADAVAHSAPSAPGAGFAAGLASSPFAPALRHVLPLPSAPSFDVRSLFGGGLSATYLAGLLSSSTDEVQTLSRMLPSWATAFGGAAATSDAPSIGERSAPSFAATYVSPDAPDDAGGDFAAAPGVTAARAQLESARTQLEAVTTMRSTLLSYSVDSTPAGTTVGAPEIAATSTTSARSPMSTPTARTMIEAMSMPLLSDAADDRSTESSAWTQPGMIADRAHAWSVAQERSSADLAFDFVPPELVLAARVYGLGPAEAAQAARLALAGPGSLTAMAGTVDRTFVQAMAMEAERRERLATAYPSKTGDVIATSRRADVPASETLPDVTPAALAQTLGSAGTAFGVDRKSPRGAFLWPSATVAALGLNAAAPDGQQSMSVAALELLAAQAVAELGTFTALADNAPDAEATSTEQPSVAERASAAAARTLAAGSPRAEAQSAEPSEADVMAQASSLVPSSRRSRFDALYVALSQSSASASWSPAARAARALALAGRGEDGATASSARERAAFAWDVLPVVYAEALGSTASEGTSSSVVASDGTLPSERRAVDRIQNRRTIGGRDYVAVDDINVDARPGLSGLSARAGEALGSYVAPQSAAATSTSAPVAASSSTREREVGALLRVPTAAQELVRTGRPSGRHGGGETEIPAWFEQAARKMLEERSTASDGISLAELTLVTAAPSSHVAASTRSAPSAAPIAPGANSQAQTGEAGASNIDIEKIASDIYRHILGLMDVARARNGEPFL